MQAPHLLIIDQEERRGSDHVHDEEFLRVLIKYFGFCLVYMATRRQVQANRRSQFCTGTLPNSIIVKDENKNNNFGYYKSFLKFY